MGIYITQGNYTQSAIKGMVDHPEDREKAVAGLAESIGARMLQYYVTSGEYDFLIVFEGDNLKDMLAALMVAGATGGVTNLKTVEAVTTKEAKAAMEKAKTARAAFRPAGSGH